MRDENEYLRKKLLEHQNKELESNRQINEFKLKL